MEKPPGRVETDLIVAVESRETSQPGRSTVTPRKLKTISKSTSKSTNLSNFQAKKNFFEHYMKKGDILTNVTGQLATMTSSLTFCAQDYSVANRRADNRICKDSPGTGHQGRELIGQEGTGKEEKGGAQPMGEQLRNLARDGREGLKEEKS